LVGVGAEGRGRPHDVFERHFFVREMNSSSNVAANEAGVAFALSLCLYRGCCPPASATRAMDVAPLLAGLKGSSNVAGHGDGDGMSEHVTCHGISQDGRVLAVASGRTLVVFDVRS